jgi:hypothetical protein
MGMLTANSNGLRQLRSGWPNVNWPKSDTKKYYPCSVAASCKPVLQLQPHAHRRLHLHLVAGSTWSQLAMGVSDGEGDGMDGDGEGEGEGDRNCDGER